MPESSESSTHRGQILLLASERQVYAFDLAEHFRIALGRHESNDVPLSSRTVSNYHAEILNESDGLMIHDLRSTNGTHVNDERVIRQRLQEGDQIRIANHVLGVHLVSSAGRWRSRNASIDIGTSGRVIPLHPSSPEVKKTLPANGIRDLSLPDLLTTLSTSRKSGILLFRTDRGDATIFIREGRVVHAEYGRARAEKALYRLFTCEDATYEVNPPRQGEPVKHTISLPTETLVMEATQHAEALATLKSVLPPFDEPLGLVEYCPLPLSALSPGEIEVFQCIMKEQTIEGVLESSPLTDFRVLSLVHSLYRKKIVDLAGDPSDGALETPVLRREN